tara:strand:+ start:179949 stop:180974 length:1026 start_codon:yes stop_codon:yes gene_type:complete
MNIKLTYCWLLFLLISTALFAQDSTTTVTAEKGDGIYSLLRKKGINPYKYYDEFISLNSSNLRDSTHLYEGKVYRLPKVDTLSIQPEINTTVAGPIVKVSHDIFGEKHKETSIKSNRLSGAIYYLISGHGGPDPGTVTNYNNQIIAEDEYAYDVTLRLAKELIAHGAIVYMIVRDENDGIRNERILTIDYDEVVYPNERIPLNQMQRLKQRTETVNALYNKHQGAYRRLIVTHVDSRSSGRNIDVFFYHHKKSKNGKKLAVSIHQTFKEKYKKYQPNRAYTGTFSHRNLYLVKNTLPAMAYIEIGNIKNEKDQRRIMYPVNRQALAEWIAEGVLVDFENGI